MKEKDILFSELEQWDFPDFQCKDIKRVINKVVSEEKDGGTEYSCYNDDDKLILVALLREDGVRPDLKILNK